MVYHKIKNADLIWHFFSLIIITISIYLRFSGIGHESLWFDEGYTYAVSQMPLSKLTIPFDVHPPLFYIIESLFISEEASEKLLRLPSVIASFLTVLLIYIVATNLIGAKGAAIATLFIGLSFTHLAYTANARNYALLILLFFASCFSITKLYQYLSKNIWPRYKATGFLLIYFLSSVACLYTHNIAVVYLTMLNTVLLFFSTGNRNILKKKYVASYIILNVAIFIFWLPWLSVLYATSEEFEWLVQPGVTESIRQYLSLIGPKSISLWLAIPCLACLITALSYSLYKAPVTIKIIAITTTIAIPLAVFSIGYIKPLYMERTILPALIGFSLCLGFMVSDLTGKIIPSAIILLFASAFSLSAYEYHNRNLEEDNVGGRLSQNWRAAIGSANDEEIFIVDSFSVPVATYYAGENKIHIFDNEILPVTLDSWRDYFTSPIKDRRKSDIRFVDFLKKNTAPFFPRNKNIVVIEVKVFTKDSKMDIYNSYLAKSNYHQFLLNNNYTLKESINLAGLKLFRYTLKS
jgi:uncharacterized membrane protein